MFRPNIGPDSAWPAEIVHVEHFRVMQILRSTTDLDLKKSDMKQIFPDTAPENKCGAHIKEQTDERISQTTFVIQSCEAKR